MFPLECTVCIPVCGKQRSSGKFHISHLLEKEECDYDISSSTELAGKFCRKRYCNFGKAFGVYLISLPVRLCSQELFLRQSPNDAEHWYTTAWRYSTFSFTLLLFLSLGTSCQKPSSAITSLPPGHSAPTETQTGTIVNLCDNATLEISGVVQFHPSL